MKVVNLYGGPGAGKSTIAAGLFAHMKMEGHIVELVTEVARDEINSGNPHMLKYQDWIFAHQHHRISRLAERGIEYVITDSPLLLMLIYAEDVWATKSYLRSFKAFVLDVDDTYHSFNYFVQRQNEFEDKDRGRVHTLNEAIAIDDKILNMLNYHGKPYTTIPADPLAPEAIYNLLTYDEKNK